MAYWGAPTGPKEANSEVSALPVTSAVPVLPASGTALQVEPAKAW